LRNGFVKNFIHEHYETESKKSPGFKVNEFLIPFFMSLLLEIRSISLEDK
jgi:hypothetical protein